MLQFQWHQKWMRARVKESTVNTVHGGFKASFWVKVFSQIVVCCSQNQYLSSMILNTYKKSWLTNVLHAATKQSTLSSVHIFVYLIFHQWCTVPWLSLPPPSYFLGIKLQHILSNTENKIKRHNSQRTDANNIQSWHDRPSSVYLKINQI